ncbi:Abi-alpha family protein [Sphingomonas sp. BAUL-RG-20F-R05-02]|uniref:Abi-alpha family protein n=1 Tax=Sphingomonas sp. BAUL-RG-20F-R05-02 TaxID=2914830 RepID=UPI001F5A398C|nr:Abi-alpha family protein [Sphingomonas sp. BAUL-RG-20F-R05-02]
MARGTAPAAGIYLGDEFWQQRPMDALGLGKAIDLVKEMMAPVGGSLSEAWASLIGDRATYWRMKNAMKYQPLLKAEADRLGLKMNAAKIPDKFAFTWFDEATKQDEPEIQVLFARLLARASDDGVNTGSDRRLIDVLARLTPEDASLFQRMYSDEPFPDTGVYSDTHGIGDDREKGWPVDWLYALLKHVHPNFTPISIDNLVVQGCLSRAMRLDFSGSGGAVATKTPEHIAWGREISSRVKQREYIDATELGKALYLAVKA